MEVAAGVESVVSIASLLKHPVLIFSFLVIVILAWIIVSQQKTIKDHVTYEREMINQLGANSTTLARLATLIETLVHGRGGHK